MSNENQTWYQILWQRIHRPLILLGFCLMAAFTLIYIQNKKSDFDKKETAPLVIVDSKDEKSDSERFGTVYNLAATLSGFDESDRKEIKNKLKCNIKDPTGNENDKNQTKICQELTTGQIETLSSKNISDKFKNYPTFLNIVRAIRYQPFKNEDELIAGLNSVAASEKERQMKASENRASDALKADVDLENQKTLAIDELNKFKFDNQTGIYFTKLNANIQEQINTQPANAMNGSVILRRVLNKKPIQPSNKGNVDHDDIIKSINSFFNEEHTRQQENIKNIENDILKKNAAFEPIVKNIYTTIKVEQQVGSLFRKAAVNPVTKRILDSNDNLNVIYKLFEVTLMGLIVFGLLYIILIPLKHLFFITTSTDTLTEKAKGFLNGKSFSGGTGATLGQALIVTVTTIGIGSAVLAGAAFSAKTGNNYETPDDTDYLTRPPRILINPKTGKPYGDSKDINKVNENVEIAQLNVDRLAENVTTLNTTVDNLKNEVQGKSNVGVENAINNLTDSVNKLNGSIGTNDPVKEGTVLGNIHTLSGKITGEGDSVFSKLDAARDIIKNRKSPGTNDLFGNIENISDILYKGKDTKNTPSFLFTNLDNILNKQERFSKDLKTVSDNIGTPGSTDPKNLFSNLKLVSDVIGAKGDRVKNPTSLVGLSELTNQNTIDINKNTIDAGKYIIGGSGNLLTQTKTLFTRQKYLINPFLIAKLKSLSSTELKSVSVSERDNIINALENLVKKEPDRYLRLSEKQLYKELVDGKVINKSQLDDLIQIIFEYSRIGRY